ncbi:5588_t:CDS:2 [Funneliformis geosporum]|uniref:15700_t:CDS:1 n=1 Tax=Funneliformis geosporum TaxID=1117311 RepID=A0A9W4SPZ9_9GLOM|nr:5588_t:CDS:2 [Funneliformis geosporum]CAI2176266.1 15700_t:CDS:2 [Funneliformis geosporum]
MTYVTRLSVKKNLRQRREINNNKSKSVEKGRTNNQQKRKGPLSQQKPKFVKVYINDILSMKIEKGEEYVLLAYSDSNLVPDWQPMRNLRNANALVEKFKKRQSLISNLNKIIINVNGGDYTEVTHTIIKPDKFSNDSSSKSSVDGDDIEMK